jgi:predicted nucleotidyltransferase component of viral defense system
MKDTRFFHEAELMLRTIPFVAKEACFALKGGTAINFFVRDFPRLSVDIDLVYLPIEGREQSLAGISAALDRIAVDLERAYPDARVTRTRRTGSKATAKLVVRRQDVQIKIEPNEVIRGTVFPSEDRVLVPKAEEFFELSAEIQTASLPDLFGGKLCAALDRQHPRDLFDMKILMENEGITEEIRQAFVVYLASHDRPMNELLDPPRHDIRRVFENEFRGMTASPVTCEELEAAREHYIAVIGEALTQPERQFLFSLKLGEPDWTLLPIAGVDRLPAVQWKLLNIRRMSVDKRKQSAERLRRKLGL